MRVVGDRSVWPSSTTLVSGACLVPASAISLMASAGLLDGVLLLLDDIGFAKAISLVASLLTTVGFAVLALGAKGEVGVAGASRLGVLGLLLYGGRDFLWVFLPSPDESAVPGALAIAQVSSSVALVLVGVLLILAVIKVFSANLLTGAARWLLLLLAATALFFALRIALPGASDVPILGSLNFEQLLPALTLAFAICCLLYGRIEGLKYRLRLASN